MQCNPEGDILYCMLTENVSYFYDFSIDIRKDVRYNTNIYTEYMFGIFVWNICIARIIYNMYFQNLFVLDFARKTPRVHQLSMEGFFMQEMSIRTTAQIYNFSELQKKKHERELREKRPFFITGIIVFISLLTICCFLYFSNSIVRAKEPSSDIQYKVVEVQEGDSLWSIARENMEEKSNDYGFTDIYQYIHEIKKCNNMKSNQINTGCYLMVPYYN